MKKERKKEKEKRKKEDVSLASIPIKSFIGQKPNLFMQEERKQTRKKREGICKTRKKSEIQIISYTGQTSHIIYYIYTERKEDRKEEMKEMKKERKERKNETHSHQMFYWSKTQSIYVRGNKQTNKKREGICNTRTKSEILIISYTGQKSNISVQKERQTEKKEGRKEGRKEGN